MHSAEFCRPFSKRMEKEEEKNGDPDQDHREKNDRGCRDCACVSAVRLCVCVL